LVDRLLEGSEKSELKWNQKHSTVNNKKLQRKEKRRKVKKEKELLAKKRFELLPLLFFSCDELSKNKNKKMTLFL